VTNSDLLSEIVEEFESVSEDQRTPDISLSGKGDSYSDPFDAPGGIAIFEMDFKNNGRYKIKAVGQTVEDDTIKVAGDETPVVHRTITRLDEGTYILNVSAESGNNWVVDGYFTAPDPVSLPVERSGRGDDLIGPIPHSGFIKITAVNYYTSRMTVKQPKADGKGYLNSPSFSIDASTDDQGTTKKEIMSTKDGRDNYPWLRIDCDGSWEIEVEAHN
jgi:hypothetical protein